MEALDFGKYNLYIWASYGLTFIVSKKKLIKDIKRRNYLNNDGSNDSDLDNINEKAQ